MSFFINIFHAVEGGSSLVFCGKVCGNSKKCSFFLCLQGLYMKYSTETPYPALSQNNQGIPYCVVGHTAVHNVGNKTNDEQFTVVLIARDLEAKKSRLVP